MKKLSKSLLITFLIVILIACGNQTSNETPKKVKNENISKQVSKEQQRKDLIEFEHQLTTNLDDISQTWHEFFDVDSNDNFDMLMAQYDNYSADRVKEKIESVKNDLKITQDKISVLKVPESLPSDIKDKLTDALITLQKSFPSNEKCLDIFFDIVKGNESEKEIAQLELNDEIKILDNYHIDFERKIDEINQIYNIDKLNYFIK
jgi:hypothetical protein